MSDGPQASERGTLSAAHTPRHIARFRKSGKRRFPDFRREADAQQKRWEAKRSRERPLAGGALPHCVRPAPLADEFYEPG